MQFNSHASQFDIVSDRLNMSKQKNYGFIEPEIKDEDYRFGSGQIDVPILRLDGQWDDCIPKDEKQNVYLETYNCTGFGFNNQIEFLMKAKFNGDYDYSDRFTGIMAGTKPPGNDPNKVYQSGRDNGFIPELMLPFSSNLKTSDDYYSFKDVNEKDCQNEGKKWLGSFELKHDWVHSNNLVKADPAMIKAALRYSPLGVAVNAWNFDGKYYVRAGKDNHWVVLYGYDTSGAWKIYDSYEMNRKLLTPDFGFYFIKRISIEKQATPQELNWIEQILKKIAELIPLFAFLVKKKLENTATPVVQPNSEETPPKVNNITPPIEKSPEATTVPKNAYLWDTREKSRHSVRLIADEEGLSVFQKNELCATIACETNNTFDPKITHQNKNAQGIVWSTDWGICQINDFYWVGEGKLFPSGEYIQQNPEKCVRWMCGKWRANKMNLWGCYKNQGYKKYL